MSNHQNKGDNESIQSKGGHARAAAMTPAARSEQAAKAATTRWGNRRDFEIYRLPLKEERMVEVKAPDDITPDEVHRLIEWLKLTLIVDAPPETGFDMTRVNNAIKAGSGNFVCLICGKKFPSNPGSGCPDCGSKNFTIEV